jgi:hypothetical protein
MKSAKRSCPVRHDSRFSSLRLCEGCVSIDCPQAAAEQADVLDFGAVWPPVAAEAVFIETEIYE